MYIIMRAKKTIPQTYQVFFLKGDEDLDGWKQAQKLEPGDMVIQGEVVGAAIERHDIVVMPWEAKG